MCNTIILAGIIGILLLAIIILGKKHLNEGFCNGNGNSNSFSDTPWTIDKPTKLIITDIIRKILNNINQQTGMSYYFTAYDQLKQDIIAFDTTRFTADLFVHEIKNLFTRRMIIVFTVNFSTKQVQVEYINLSNAFKNPDKSFMDYPAPALLLQDDNLLHNEYHIMGISNGMGNSMGNGMGNGKGKSSNSNSTLDFSILKNSEILPKDVPTPTEFQKWILPMGIASSYQNPQSIFPSRRQSDCWDNNGVNYIEPQNNLQIGVNNTHLTRYPFPYINPTVNRQRQYNTEYKWMFDLADSHSGFGRGVSSSP
jgi:hypothetical protein